jgi:tRNA A37 methylthiotransferase MiaB
MLKNIYMEGEACNRKLLELTKIRTYFELNEYEIVSKPEKSEMIFFFTCAFKEQEKNYSIECIEWLRELTKYGKEMFVYECLPNISPGKYSEFSEIRNLAPKDLEKIDECLDPCHEKKHTPAAGIEGELPAELINSRTAEAFKFFKHHS